PRRPKALPGPLRTLHRPRPTRRPTRSEPESRRPAPRSEPPQGARSSSELRRLSRARVRNHVADVGHARGKLHRALKAQSETRVGHRAVAPQVQIPPVVLHVHAQFRDAAFQAVAAFLALTAADDLA